MGLGRMRARDMLYDGSPVFASHVDLRSGPSLLFQQLISTGNVRLGKSFAPPDQLLQAHSLEKSNSEERLEDTKLERPA